MIAERKVVSGGWSERPRTGRGLFSQLRRVRGYFGGFTVMRTLHVLFVQLGFPLLKWIVRRFRKYVCPGCSFGAIPRSSVSRKLMFGALPPPQPSGRFAPVGSGDG